MQNSTIIHPKIIKEKVSWLNVEEEILMAAKVMKIYLVLYTKTNMKISYILYNDIQYFVSNAYET